MEINDLSGKELVVTMMLTKLRTLCKESENFNNTKLKINKKVPSRNHRAGEYNN